MFLGFKEQELKLFSLFKLGSFLRLDKLIFILTVIAFGGIFVEMCLLNTLDIPLHIILVIRILIIFMFLFSVFMNRLYKRYSKQVKIVVLFTGLGVITTLLGCNTLPCIGLVIFFYCIIRILYIIIDKDNHLLDNSVLLCITTVWLFITTVIAVYTFTDLAITPEFQINYPHLSKMDLILIYLGSARIIIDIVFNNNRSYFAKIKKTITKFSAYLKENPLFYLGIGLVVLLVFIFLINFYT